MTTWMYESDMEDHNYLFAFLLTLFAGLSTGIGGLLSVIIKRDNTRFLAISLGLSAGVMIYVSFMELMPEGKNALAKVYGGDTSGWIMVAAFFSGIFIIAAIDKLIPESMNPHELLHHPDMEAAELAASSKISIDHAKLHRTGVFTALAIAVHNFPEGLATFTAALTEPALGLAIAAAIAIHNVPEGMAVAVPIYFATGSRKSALAHSFFSGLAEPLGAIVGFTLLRPFFTPATFGILFGIVAGIMVFISLDELLPSAEKYGEHHLSIYGVVSGMAIMAITMVLLGHNH